MSSLVNGQSEIFNRCTILIDEADAKIAHTWAVDNSATNDVPTLIERESIGDAVIHHHTPVTGEDNGFFAVEPPHGCSIGPNCQANVLLFIGAGNDGDCPEQNAVHRPIEAVSEAKEFDIEIGGVQRMPREYLICNRDLVAVVRNNGDLVGKVLGIEGVSDIAVSEDSIAAVRLIDRFEKQPALKEPVGVRSSGGGCCRREVRGDAASSIAGGRAQRSAAR